MGGDGVEGDNASDGVDFIQQITMADPMTASRLFTVENGSVHVHQYNHHRPLTLGIVL